MFELRRAYFQVIAICFVIYPGGSGLFRYDAVKLARQRAGIFF